MNRKGDKQFLQHGSDRTGIIPNAGKSIFCFTIIHWSRRCNHSNGWSFNFWKFICKFVSRPLQGSLEALRSPRRVNIFSFLRVAVMKRFSAPAGSRLFIDTGSVDMNIIPLFLLLCSVAQGLLQPGR